MSEFARIFSPRIEKAVKSISLLTNGVRYKPTTDETSHLMDALKDAVNDIAQLYGVLPKSEDIDTAPIALNAAQDSRAEASRIDANIDAIKRSPFARQDVHVNVASIPEVQLTAYATSILARICERFEDPEAQPKNYVVKDKDPE